MNLYPRIFKAKAIGKIFFRYTGDVLPEIKVQPMEKYLIPHDKMRIDEEDRYPYYIMTKENEGLFSYCYEFLHEQKYSVIIRINGETVLSSHVYALENDLYSLRFFKGDTHIHTTRSDGLKSPLETACAYRAAGYDFIAVTDHHQFDPSIETINEISSRTNLFTAFRGEEVHNGSMGYIHIVSFNGQSSVSKIIDNDQEYVKARINTILAENNFEGLSHPYTAAYRIFVADEIRKAGGIPILTHPLWDAYGEYNMDMDELAYHLKNNTFDAFELLADDDRFGNGDNLQTALYYELASKGVKTSLLGASDCHDTDGELSYFNRHFSLVFAPDAKEIPNSVKKGMCVAVNRRSDNDFFVFGDFRLVKYARFVLNSFYPEYAALTSEHAKALAESDGTRTEKIIQTENVINDFTKMYFGK